MKLIKHNGRRMCIAAWARELGIESATLQARISSGWDIETALTKPVQFRKATQTETTLLISPELKARMAKSYSALGEHLQREMQAFLNSFRAAASLQAEQAARDMAFIYSRGVGENFQEGAGTGGGSTARGSAEIEFSRRKAIKS